MVQHSKIHWCFSLWWCWSDFFPCKQTDLFPFKSCLLAHTDLTFNSSSESLREHHGFHSFFIPNWNNIKNLKFSHFLPKETKYLEVSRWPDLTCFGVSCFPRSFRFNCLCLSFKAATCSFSAASCSWDCHLAGSLQGVPHSQERHFGLCSAAICRKSVLCDFLNFSNVLCCVAYCEQEARFVNRGGSATPAVWLVLAGWVQWLTFSLWPHSVNDSVSDHKVLRGFHVVACNVYSLLWCDFSLYCLCMWAGRIYSRRWCQHLAAGTCSSEQRCVELPTCYLQTCVEKVGFGKCSGPSDRRGVAVCQCTLPFGKTASCFQWALSLP